MTVIEKEVKAAPLAGALSLLVRIKRKGGREGGREEGLS